MKRFNGVGELRSPSYRISYRIVATLVCWLLLAAQASAQTHRVGAIGFSRTAWQVEGAIVDDPTMFAAASIADGIDQSYVQYLMWGGRSDGPSLYGANPFGPGLHAWVKDAPGFHLDRVQAPVLVTALGAGSVLAEWEIYASLRLQKKPVDLLYLPQPDGNRHVIRKPLSGLRRSRRTSIGFGSGFRVMKIPTRGKRPSIGAGRRPCGHCTLGWQYTSQ